MTSRPVRVLDLYCKAGGASVGYKLAAEDLGVDIELVGVDIEPQPNYPFDFRQGDALDVDLEDFDVVHASPPCQIHSTLAVMPNARDDHVDLVAPTREKIEASGLPYIIENVVGAPLEIGPLSLITGRGGVTLCGSMFGLDNGEYELRRHRLFESNVALSQPACRHRLPVVGFYGDHARTIQPTVGGRRQRSKADITDLDRKMALVRDLMGIDWMTWTEATQAIPPAFTRHVGRELLVTSRPQ